MLSDFTREDGSVDWASYRKAQIEAGEACYRCEHFIVYPTEKRHLCYSCQELDTNKKQRITHQSLVRCPECSHLSNVHEWDCDSADIYEEGEHLVQCNRCNHEFEITTEISYLFKSPPEEEK